MPLRRLTMPSAMRVLGLLASVRALQFTPVKRSFQLQSSAETELTIDPIAVTTESTNTAADVARWRPTSTRGKEAFFDIKNATRFRAD